MTDLTDPESDFFITHNVKEEQVDLDFVDRVIAKYDIDLIFQGGRKREVRKLFYDQLSHKNLEEV